VLNGAQTWQRPSALSRRCAGRFCWTASTSTQVGLTLEQLGEVLLELCLSRMLVEI
jgi:hypothetical protein